MSVHLLPKTVAWALMWLQVALELFALAAAELWRLSFLVQMLRCWCWCCAALRWLGLRTSVGSCSHVLYSTATVVVWVGRGVLKIISFCRTRLM